MSSLSTRLKKIYKVTVSVKNKGLMISLNLKNCTNTLKEVCGLEMLIYLVVF